MQFFAPEFKHHIPPAMSNSGLASWLVGIDERDVGNIVDLWKTLGVEEENDDPYNYPRLRDAPSIATVCEYQFKHRTALIPFLRRPYVTVQCGASEGFNPDFPHAEGEMSEFEEEAYEMGRIIAEAGLNLRYGGGKKGLMGCVMRGFMDWKRENPQPDQYCVQVLPARFVRMDKSASGMRPLNEGLCYDTDGAIIVPSMPTRYLALSIGAEGVFVLTGGDGTYAEFYGEKVVGKIGASNRAIHIVDRTPRGSSESYYSDLARQEDKALRFRFNRPNGNVIWSRTPREAMDKFLAALQARPSGPQDPDSIYRANMKNWKETPISGPDYQI